jgi:hypothetical protein
MTNLSDKYVLRRRNAAVPSRRLSNPVLIMFLIAALIVVGWIVYNFYGSIMGPAPSSVTTTAPPTAPATPPKTP